MFTRKGNTPRGEVVFSPNHAKNAVARAQQMFERGLLTKKQKSSIDRKAAKLLLKTDSFKTKEARQKAEKVAFGEFPFTKCMKNYSMGPQRGVPIYPAPMPRGSAPRFAPKGAKPESYNALAHGAGYVARQDLHPQTTYYPNDRRDLAMREWGGQVQAGREWPGWGGSSQFGEDDWDELPGMDEVGRQWPYVNSEQPGWPGSPGLSSGYGPVFPYVPKPYAEFGGNPTTKSLYKKWLAGAPLSNTALRKLERAGYI